MFERCTGCNKKAELVCEYVEGLVFCDKCVAALMGSRNHHPDCEPIDCHLHFCHGHRLLYYWCQSAVSDRGELFNGGECPQCCDELARKRIQGRPLQIVEAPLKRRVS